MHRRGITASGFDTVAIEETGVLDARQQPSKYWNAIRGASQDAPFLFYDVAVVIHFDPIHVPTSPASTLFSAIVTAPFGNVGVRTDTAIGVLCELVYLPPSFAPKAATDRIAAQAARQLRAYFKQADFQFDLPLASVGTIFQQRVWQAISDIQRGKVLTYGAIARGLRSAPRAVGQACGANWFPLVVPCHRVVAAAGLGGFANSTDDDGFYLTVKRWLLAHEGVTYR